MAKCKRIGCEEDGIDYAGYAGCCSLYCRDVHELDEEIAEKDRRIEELVALLSDARAALDDLGACDDPKCSEPNCNHALVRIDAALARRKK